MHGEGQDKQAEGKSNPGAEPEMRITAYPLYDHAATLKPSPEGKGWNFLCPSAFEACWNGGPDAKDVEIRFAEESDGTPGPAGFVQSQQGRGLLTFYPGYQCKTAGDDALWVRGPANAPKDGLSPLESTVDTSVLPGTVSIDWQFTRPGQTVRFAAGEPFCTILPYPKAGRNDAIVDVVPLAGAGDIDAFEAGLERLAESQAVQGVLARLAASQGEPTVPERRAKSRWATRLTEPHAPPMPAVSCICKASGLTGSRVELLEEAIQAFLEQDYPGPKELLVLNDDGRQTLVYDHPEVLVVNLPSRFHSKAEAFKAAVGLAAYDLLFVWPDDAISLPHRLSFSVAHFGGREALFKADKAWIWNAGELSGPEPEAPHGGGFWRRDAFVRLHGYPHVGKDYESELEALCEAEEPGSVRVYSIAAEDVYYIRRGETAAPTAMPPLAEIPEGRIQLRPRWLTDYGALVAAHWKTQPGEKPATADAAEKTDEIPFPPPFHGIPPPAPLPPGRAERLFRGDYPKKISVILPATNESVMLERTVESFAANLPADSEIIVVDNGSTDGCADFLLGEKRENVHLLRSTEALGVSAARNRGLARAQGEIVVFADAHIDVPERFWEPLAATLDLPHVGVVAPGIGVMGRPDRRAAYGQRIAESSLRVEWLPWQAAEPYPVPTLGGGFMAMRHDTLKQAGAFDEGMPQWGSEDLEICVRYWLLGYEVWVVPEVTVLHYFRNKRPYGLQWHLLTHNLLRVALLHFNQERTARVTSALRNSARFGPALAHAVESDVWQKRAEFAARRVRDDDWLFEKFKDSCHV
jgi:GT2 family glycosyltransferase